MKTRFANITRQLGCVAVALAVVSPAWGPPTRVSEMVFGVAWVSFILAIFVTTPAAGPTLVTRKEIHEL